jgi:glycerol-3-phosphate dehydrogenase (NAD(P)+)
MRHISVVGAGAWGCALALHASRAGHDVTLWVHTAPRASLPEQVAVTHDLTALAGDVLLLAVPVQHMRRIIPKLPAVPVVACSKGVEAGSLRLPLEMLAEMRPELPLAVLSGPNFAHEIAAQLPAAAVVASHDAAFREAVSHNLSTPRFRLYGGADPVGVQVCGAAKNVIAIAAGAVMGAGLGENARAALVTRGLVELGRLAAALGGQSATMAGLSGLGDLLLTCTSSSSRNYDLGFRIGQGQTLADILASRTSVTEGVATAPALVARGAGVDLPICRAVAALLAGQTNLHQAMSDLLARPRGNE